MTKPDYHVYERIFAHSHTLSGKLELYLFCVWLAYKGIPVELYSMLEKDGGYMNVLTLLKTKYARIDFKERMIYFAYKGTPIKRYYG